MTQSQPSRPTASTESPARYSSARAHAGMGLRQQRRTCRYRTGHRAACGSDRACQSAGDSRTRIHVRQTRTAAQHHSAEARIAAPATRLHVNSGERRRKRQPHCMPLWVWCEAVRRPLRRCRTTRERAHYHGSPLGKDKQREPGSRSGIRGGWVSWQRMHTPATAAAHGPVRAPPPARHVASRGAAPLATCPSQAQLLLLLLPNEGGSAPVDWTPSVGHGAATTVVGSLSSHADAGAEKLRKNGAEEVRKGTRGKPPTARPRHTHAHVSHGVQWARIGADVHTAASRCEPVA
jgi:hypothetical protein